MMRTIAAVLEWIAALCFALVVWATSASAAQWLGAQRHRSPAIIGAEQIAFVGPRRTLYAAGAASVPPCNVVGSNPVVDGCSGAPAPNKYTVRHPDCYTAYCLQSGQHYTALPNWNAPGVNYPVGINAATLPTGITPTTLKDPTTATLPTGCALSGSAPNYEVLCSGTYGAVTFNGFDFSLHGGVFLAIGGTANGQIILQNNHFNCQMSNTVAVAAGLCIQIRPNQSGAGACITATGLNSCLVIENNYFENNATGNLFNNIVQYNPNVAQAGYYVVYNAILGTPARFMTAGTAVGGPTVSATCQYQFNYFEGWTNTATKSAHAEVSLDLYPCGNYLATYNMVMQPAGIGCAGGASGCTMTAAFSPYEGISNTGTVAAFTVSNNVLIFNEFVGGTNCRPASCITGTAIARIAPSTKVTYGTITLTNNYVDPIGADQCYATADFAAASYTTLTQTGDTNMSDGSAISYASQPCNP